MAEIAEYELVVLQPKHFLPKGSILTRYPVPGTQGGIPRHYQIDSKRVLKEAPATEDSPRYPSFRFTGNREPKKKLNPLFVVLAGEIKFRRYRRAPNALTLDAYYESLITKSMYLADLLYLKPGDVFPADKNLSTSDDGMEIDDEGETESQEFFDAELGFRNEETSAGGSTARPLRAGRGVRKT